MCLGLSGHISTSFRCTPVTHGSALTSLNLGCTRHSRSTLHSALICTRFPGTRALCVASCPVKTRGKLSHHIGAPRRSGAWKALLLVTEGNALGPHVRPISICLEGSTPQDRTSPRNEICPTRPNPCFKRSYMNNTIFAAIHRTQYNINPSLWLMFVNIMLLFIKNQK